MLRPCLLCCLPVSLFPAGSDDATCKIWSIPDNGLTETIKEPLQVRTRRCHPSRPVFASLPPISVSPHVLPCMRSVSPPSPTTGFFTTIITINAIAAADPDWPRQARLPAAMEPRRVQRHRHSWQGTFRSCCLLVHAWANPRCLPYSCIYYCLFLHFPPLQEPSVKIWDIETGVAKTTLTGFEGLVQVCVR